ncbi:hypothetical protein NAEX_01457 [Nannocystis exedens]|nr:hypothetical protein NAEX_01457 [Nannocystis exedens]
MTTLLRETPELAVRHANDGHPRELPRLTAEDAERA